MPLTIRLETPADHRSIWNVNNLAFGQPVEANLVDALRAGGDTTVSLVAEADNQIVGHILFSKLKIVTSNNESFDAHALAPLAVLPTYQRMGIGSQLVTEGLCGCRKIGGRIAIVLGHPGFYPRFGFSADLAKSLTSPFGGGEAWMVNELEPGAMAGVVGHVEYASPFHQLQ
ncbi:GNAT family N-acetyltransferase [Schlesneria paludicola]|uniref:GNAT family N-acetyltransferase n=1 Tax=Schlesneria paludicola TaxID=360056 RepID=UPI0002F63D3E|nr:N-acetyltransferase [Schlesneria paludicola]